MSGGAGWQGAAEAVVGLGAGIFAHESSKKAQRWEFLNNQALMNQQHTQNIDMFNLQNAYNSPSAQMKRLREAGLNPALMYGGKSGGMTGSAQMPHKTDLLATQGRNHGAAALQGLMMSQDLKLKQAQTDNVNADTEKKGVEQIYIRTKETALDLENSIFHLKRSGIISDNYAKRFRNELNDLTKFDQRDKIMFDAQNAGLKRDLSEQSLIYNTERHTQQMIKIGQEILNLKAGRGLIRQQIKTEKTKRLQHFAQSDYLSAQTEIKKMEKQFFEWTKVVLPTIQTGTSLAKELTNIISAFVRKGGISGAVKKKGKPVEPHHKVTYRNRATPEEAF